MIIIPVLMNALVFWITDSFIKNDKKDFASTVDFELTEGLSGN